MAGLPVDQSQARMMRLMWVLLVVALLLPPVRALTEPTGTDPTHPAIRKSAIGPVVLWCWYWPLAFARSGPAGTTARRRRAAAAGWCGLICAALLLHVAVAFHLGHGWSHEAAWQHTQQVGGYGDGIYVNYGFVLVWCADAVWSAGWPASYATRPQWLSWAVHVFLAFVVFNAAVVFGGWLSRVVFGFFFLLVAGLFVVGKWYERRPGYWQGQDRDEEGAPA